MDNAGKKDPTRIAGGEDVSDLPIDKA